MAAGMNGSYGFRTEFDPNRSVTKAAMPQSLASKLHYGGKSSREIYDMPDTEWDSLSKGGIVTRDEVFNRMRAYEHYSDAGPSNTGSTD